MNEMAFDQQPHAESVLTMFASAAAAFAKPDDKRALHATRSANGFDRKIWTELAEQGWLAIVVPENLGGLGLGVSAAAIIARRLGYVAYPEPFVAAGVMAPACLAKADNPEQCCGYLTSIMKGNCVATVAWQGESGGMAAQDCGVRITPAKGGAFLSGTSRFVPVPSADVFVVAALAREGLEFYWVPRNAPGLVVDCERVAGGAALAKLALDKVHLSLSARLVSSAHGSDVLRDATAMALIASSAELVGVMSKALEMTLEYLRTRKQFGVAIGTFQALQHRAVDLWIQVKLAEAAVQDSAALFDNPATTSEVRRAAGYSAKARAGQAALLVCSQAMQMHGAIGFTDEYGLGLYLNRTLALSAWMGNDAWHRRAWLASGAGDSRTQDLASERRKPGDCAVSAAPDQDLNALSDHDFRMLVRGDFERHYPAELRYPAHRLRWSVLKPWYLRMASKGWLAPNWPRKHGGMGLTAAKSLAFLEEQERWGIARFPDHGILMVGPVLMRFGTDAQRARFLGPILKCEEIWCQGYSEPNAGSDLAAVRTTAERDGADFVINGQKIWTTLAQDATHIFVLARTDQNAKKQEGISFLLVDLASPGITVRPIRDIAGHEELNEVFFDNVRTSSNNLVGELNDGWTIAKSLLGFERISLGSPKLPEYGLQVLVAVARTQGMDEDPVFLDRLAALRLDVIHLAKVYQGFVEIAERGAVLGPEVSMLKIFATELFQRIADLIIEMAGPCGAMSGKVGIGSERLDVLGPFYKARPATIYGGSNEIQRNIIAKQVLDLPSR
jgi:alkylation response protein AidB-like acyl-CoA dehydrogenase